MANPFLARLLDTQQRGLQAERERQMRNQGFGNLGFLGQSLQRSFQPLAEMRQQEELQKQQQDASMARQKQQQAFEKQKAIDEIAAKYNLGFDKERNRYYREGGYDVLTGGSLPGKRTYVSPAEIQSNIELEKAKKLAGFATDENLRQNRGLLDQKFDEAVRNLQGIYNPDDNSVRIPTGYNNETKQVIYGEPMSLQDAKNLSDQRNLKATEEVKSQVRVDESEKVLDSKDRRAAEKMGIKYDPSDGTYYKEEFEDGDVYRVPVNFTEVQTALEAQKSKAVATATGEAETEVLVGREKRLRPEKIKTLKEEYATKLNADKNRYEYLTRDQLEDQLEIAVRQAKQIGDDDLARRLEEFGAQPYESLADAKNRNRYNALIDELGVRLDFKIEEATNIDLLEAELDKVKGLKDVEYASLREHEKIIATDQTLQDALIKNLEKKAEATAKGQDTVEIERERRKIGYETLSKGINALIETDNNITVEQIKDLATGTGLSEEALTQMVYSANAQGTKTRIERKLLMAQNDLLTKEQRFDILNTVPVSKGGFKGSKLKFEDYERNARIVDHFVDRGIELTDEELESAGYKTKESKNLIKKLSKDTKHTKTLKDIATQVESILQSDPLDQPLDGSGMLTRDQRLKNIFEEINSDPAKKEALEARGYDYKWFKGNADRIAREIEKDEADIKLVKATALGKLSKDSEVKEGVREDIFRDRMKVLFTQYEASPEKLAIEEARLRRNLYGSTDGGPPFGGSTGVPTGSNTENNQSGSLGNQLRTGGGFVTKGEEEAKEEVSEPITQPLVEQPASQDRSVIRRDASTPPEAVREVLQDKRPMKEGILSNALRVIDDVLGGDSLNQKRAREIYNGVSSEMGGEAQMLNTLSGKSKEEVGKILRDNAPKRGGEGYGKDTRIRIPDDTVDKIFEAVKEYDNFVQPVASIDT